MIFYISLMLTSYCFFMQKSTFETALVYNIIIESETEIIFVVIILISIYYLDLFLELKQNKIQLIFQILIIEFFYIKVRTYLFEEITFLEFFVIKFTFLLFVYIWSKYYNFKLNYLLIVFLFMVIGCTIVFLTFFKSPVTYSNSGLWLIENEYFNLPIRPKNFRLIRKTKTIPFYNITAHPANSFLPIIMSNILSFELKFKNLIELIVTSITLDWLHNDSSCINICSVEYTIFKSVMYIHIFYILYVFILKDSNKLIFDTFSFTLSFLNIVFLLNWIQWFLLIYVVTIPLFFLYFSYIYFIFILIFYLYWFYNRNLNRYFKLFLFVLFLTYCWFFFMMLFLFFIFNMT